MASLVFLFYIKFYNNIYPLNNANSLFIFLINLFCKFMFWILHIWLICFANDVTADFMSTVFIVTRIVTEEVPIALKYRGAAAPKQWFEPHGIWASRLGLSLQAGIWALRPEYGLLDWDMTLKAGIWASRLGYEPWTWALRLVLVPQGWNLSKRLGFEHWR